MVMGSLLFVQWGTGQSRHDSNAAWRRLFRARRFATAPRFPEPAAKHAVSESQDYSGEDLKHARHQSDHRLVASAVRRVAVLAVQPQLGLLPLERSRPGADRRPGARPHRTVLTGGSA